MDVNKAIISEIELKTQRLAMQGRLKKEQDRVTLLRKCFMSSNEPTTIK